MAQPQPSVLQGEWTYKDRDRAFQDDDSSPCSCGTNDDPPFKVDCRNNDGIYASQYILRREIENARSEMRRNIEEFGSSDPPRKRRRTDALDDPERSSAVVACEESLETMLDGTYDSDEEPARIDNYGYICKGGELRTHVARANTSSGHSKMRLVIRGAPTDTGESYPLDLMVREAGQTKSKWEDIEMAGRISHIQWGARLAGRFWTETRLNVWTDGTTYSLQIYWVVKWDATVSLDESVRHAPEHKYIVDWMIQKLLPSHSLKSDISPQAFYESIHTPPKGDPVAEKIKVDGMVPALYGYQRRSVRWMLNREGVDWSTTTNSLISRPKGMSVDTLHKVVDAEGKICFVSPVFNVVAKSRVGLANEDINGGLLLEEMGLGKTIEIMSLILLHRRPLGQEAAIFDEIMSIEVTPIRATLIICPPAILRQWEEELDKHAPKLNVFTYKGINGHKNMKASDLAKHFAIQDVVLTTYNVIGKEVHFLKPPPPRSLRSRSGGKQPRYEATISPLVKFSWWRTILDEVQMIEGGMSNAAQVAGMIPRVNAWGVSGTPVKNDISGMRSLLSFLRYEPFGSDKAAWKALLTRDSTAFKAMCASIAIRHTKQMVKNEMTLPAQKRFVLRMPFSKIEEQHYHLLFHEGCFEVGLTEIGEPLLGCEKLQGSSEQQFKLKKFLKQLRMNTLYPVTNGVDAKKSKKEPQTASDLLQQMLLENLAEMNKTQRALLALRINRGKLHAFSFNVRDPESALETWLSFSNEADEAVKAALDGLDKAWVNYDAAEAAMASKPASEDATRHSSLTALDDIIKVQDIHFDRMLALQHAATFLCGNAYFALKEKAREGEKEEYQMKEDASYDEAKSIRQRMLLVANDRCIPMMKKLKKNLDHDDGERGGLQGVPSLALEIPAGLDKIATEVARMKDVLCTFLQMQRRLITDWRYETALLLLRPLVDAKNDPQTITGDEYDQSAKDQEKLVVSVQAYRALIEDRNDILTGTRNQLVLSEMRDSLYLANNNQGPAPDLTRQLANARTARNRTADGATFPDLVAALRAKIGEFKTRGGDARAQAALEQFLPELRGFIHKHTEAIAPLRAECAEFTRLMNCRVEYYRQLQVISDMVQDWDDYNHYTSMTKAEILTHMFQKEEDFATKIAQLKTRRRYLEHIGEPDTAEGLPQCLICTDEYENGAMTVCGHSFCTYCLDMWLRSNATCPTCKQGLRRADIHYFVYKPKALKAQEEKSSPSSLARSSVTQGIFSEVPKKSLDEILNIPLAGPPLTTKVDTLCRHIICLRQQDPTTKVLVFSQFTNFLEYLKRAFAVALWDEGIEWASISDRNGIQKFKEDKDCAVFLLDAKSQSSGLNLVEASHVFLCEPLINTAIELQAISRVDRIGQKKETTVWLYIINGTVEENIYDISVRRRLQHLPAAQRDGEDRELETALEEENSNALALTGNVHRLLDSKDRSSGENVSGDDLMEALFKNRREEVDGEPMEESNEDEAQMRPIS